MQLRNKKFGVYAGEKGVVLFVGQKKEFREGKPYFSSLGIRVYIKLSDGKVVAYCHLARTYLKEGMKVKAGSLIGIMGNTGMPKQTHVSESTLRRIRNEDAALYKWFLSFQDKSLGRKLYKTMKYVSKFFSRLEWYLNKHLHIYLFPDSKSLWGNDAIDPTDWLLRSAAVVNTKASTPFGKVNEKVWKTKHMGFDFSGLLQNLISGWKTQSKEFKKLYYKSIKEIRLA